jgi:superfamily II DNA or RNA helicase
MRDQIQAKVGSLIEASDYKSIVYAATGFGKTKVVIDALRSVGNPSTLWIVDRVKLRDVDIPLELKKWGKDLTNIVIICYNSIHRYSKVKFDFVVLDEADRITERVDSYLSVMNFKHFIAVTATRPPEAKEEMLLKYGKVVFNYSLDEASEEGVIAPYEMLVIWTLMDNEDKYIKAGNKKNQFWQTERKQLAYYDRMVVSSIIKQNNIQKEKGLIHPDYIRASRLTQIWVSRRTDLIYKSIAKLSLTKFLLRNNFKDEKLLTLTQRISIAEDLCEKTYHTMNPESDKNLDDFRKGNIKRLAACTALDRGINIPELDAVLIHQINSSQRALIQRAGRALRKREGHKGKIVIIGAKHTRDENWILEATQSIKNVSFMSEQEVAKGKFQEWERSLKAS